MEPAHNALFRFRMIILDETYADAMFGEFPLAVRLHKKTALVGEHPRRHEDQSFDRKTFEFHGNGAMFRPYAVLFDHIEAAGVKPGRPSGHPFESRYAMMSFNSPIAPPMMKFKIPTSKPVLIGIGAVLVLIAAAAYVQIAQPLKKATPPPNEEPKPIVNNVSPEPQPAEELKQTYAEPGMGYAIMFPDSWNIGKTDKGTKSVVLTGKEGTAAFGATIVIQNLLTTKTNGVYDGAKAAADDLKSQILTQGQETNISQEGDIAYTTSDKKDVPGVQWYGEFKLNGTPFKQLQLVLTHPNGMYLHSIAYAAPANVYTAVEPTAREIIRSFVMSEEPYTATSTGVEAVSSATR
jgi:hypothetical protein